MAVVAALPGRRAFQGQVLVAPAEWFQTKTSEVAILKDLK
jgi:hypothetical protein